MPRVDPIRRSAHSISYHFTFARARVPLFKYFNENVSWMFRNVAFPSSLQRRRAFSWSGTQALAVRESDAMSEVV